MPTSVIIILGSCGNFSKNFPRILKKMLIKHLESLPYEASPRLIRERKIAIVTKRHSLAILLLKSAIAVLSDKHSFINKRYLLCTSGTHTSRMGNTWRRTRTTSTGASTSASATRRGTFTRARRSTGITTTTWATTSTCPRRPASTATITATPTAWPTTSPPRRFVELHSHSFRYLLCQ